MASSLLRAALMAAGKYGPAIFNTLGVASGIKSLLGKSQPMPDTMPTANYKSGETPYEGGAIKPYEGGAIKPYEGGAIKPYEGGAITPYGETAVGKLNATGETTPLLDAATKKAKFPLGKLSGAVLAGLTAADLLTPPVIRLGNKLGGMPHSQYTPEQQDLYSAFREGINSNISGFGGPIKGMADVKTLMQQIVSDAKPFLKGADYTKNWNVLTNAMSDFLVQSGGALGIGDIDKSSAKDILRNVFITRLGGTEKLPEQNLSGPLQVPPSVPPPTGFIPFAPER